MDGQLDGYPLISGNNYCSILPVSWDIANLLSDDNCKCLAIWHGLVRSFWASLQNTTELDSFINGSTSLTNQSKNQPSRCCEKTRWTIFLHVHHQPTNQPTNQPHQPTNQTTHCWFSDFMVQDTWGIFWKCPRCKGTGRTQSETVRTQWVQQD